MHQMTIPWNIFGLIFRVNLITSDINLGFGQGNNKGIRYALENEADYVFLLNQDAWIEPDTISDKLQFIKNIPNMAYLALCIECR